MTEFFAPLTATIRRLAAVVMVLPLLSAAQCPDSKDPEPTPRKKMDCKAEWDWDSRDFAVKISATQYGSVDFGTSKKAIREVDNRVQQYAVEWGKLCREWNAGAVDQATFGRRSEAISEKMGRLDELMLVLTNAPSEAAYLESLRAAYGTMTETTEQVDLQVNLAVMAKRPSDADYGVAAPNASLPTGTKVQFVVDTSAPAHLYIYQVDAKGGIVPLFPDMRIPVTNPVPAGTQLRIPSGQASFTLNDQDIGIEHVHVVASATPMTELQTSITQTGSNPTAATAKQLDCASARGLEYDAGECPTSRGLVYDDPEGSSGYSVKAVNAAADDAVHLVYSFNHTAG
jgi:hypothetical protein